MNGLLITIGCSWTYGFCSGYEPGMSRADLDAIAVDDQLCDNLSFRGILSKKYNLTNRNLAISGTSNQQQFRIAREFFSSTEFGELQKEFDNIIVLWGITSTARNELWSVELNDLVNFHNSEPTNLTKSFVKYSYNHAHEVAQLATEMRHWNTFFKSLGIRNLWFDAFNHHDYNLPDPRIKKFEKQYETLHGVDWPTWAEFSQNQFTVTDAIFKEITDKSRWPWADLFPGPVDNLMFADSKPRDLLSLLALNNGCTDPDDQYHLSYWSVDSNRVEYLVKCGILNPYSFHPTREGHAQIADLMTESFEAIIQ